MTFDTFNASGNIPECSIWLMITVNGAAILFFKYFKVLLEILSIPELDFGFKSLIIAT